MSGPPSSPGSPSGARLVWTDGEVIFCACAHCRAPISVRPELMIADCWKCECSIELSEEQEREAQRLLEIIEQNRALEASAPPPEPEIVSYDEPASEETEQAAEERLQQRFGDDRFHTPVRKAWGVRRRFGTEG